MSSSFRATVETCCVHFVVFLLHLRLLHLDLSFTFRTFCNAAAVIAGISPETSCRTSVFLVVQLSVMRLLSL